MAIVSVSKEARNDLIGIRQYIEEELCNPNAASRIIHALECVDISRNVRIRDHFCARQGAFPQEYWWYFKGKQRGMAQKGA